MRRLACAVAIACCLPLAAARAAEGAREIMRPHDSRQQDARPKPTPTPARRDDAEKDEGDDQEQLKRLDAERPAAHARENAGKSEDQLVAEALAESIRGALRKPKAGETRARGVLSKVDCTAQGMVFHVRADRRVLRLQAEGFDKLHIMAFTAEAGGEITCGERRPESQVVVTYRATADAKPKPNTKTKADAKTKADGSLAAVEFVPADFQLKAEEATTAARPARQR